MRFIFFLLFLLAFVSFGEEENIISKSDTIPLDIQKKLGIVSRKVEKRSVNISKTYPSIVKDDLTLSEAIYSPVEGLVKKLLVKEGDYVKKGQPVAYIYSPAVAQILAQIKQGKVQLKTAKELYLKEKELFEKKVIPYNRFFKAKLEYENAKANLNALMETLRIYGEVKNNLLVLRTSMEGYVAKQNVVKGDSVGIDKMLFKIHAHNRLWTVALVPVEESVFIKKGVKATVISPLGKTTGKVDFISHQVDPDTKRVEVRVITDNTKEVLKPGMYVDTVFHIGKITGIFIPASAVVIQDGEFFVFLKEGNHFKPVSIEVGRRINGFYEVKKGLKEGQEIVVKGTVHLKAKFFGEAEE
jgi:cobalt-zinc-cadmium efflux system membrane fusion protein